MAGTLPTRDTSNPFRENGAVKMVREELRLLGDWGEHHRQLIARLTVVLAATAVFDVLGTVAIYFFERHAKNGDIHNLFDAFFFTTVQLLTVSSQITNPLTTAGRIVDIFLEIWAVIVVAGSAGAVADFFHSGTRKKAARKRAASLDRESREGRSPPMHSP
jgi:hypothetical protein